MMTKINNENLRCKSDILVHSTVHDRSFPTMLSCQLVMLFKYILCEIELLYIFNSFINSYFILLVLCFYCL